MKHSRCGSRAGADRCQQSQTKENSRTLPARVICRAAPFTSAKPRSPHTEMTDHSGAAAQSQSPPLGRHHPQCLTEPDPRAAQQPASAQPHRGEVCSHATQTTEQISAPLLKSEGTWPCQMSPNTKTQPWGPASPLLPTPVQLSVHQKLALQREQLQSWTKICPGETRTLLLLSGCRSAVTPVQHTPKVTLEAHGNCSQGCQHLQRCLVQVCR